MNFYLQIFDTFLISSGDILIYGQSDILSKHTEQKFMKNKSVKHCMHKMQQSCKKAWKIITYLVLWSLKFDR